MRNWMEKVAPGAVEELRDMWGLDEPPRWYRLFGPKWVPSEGVPPLIEVRCCVVAIFLARCSRFPVPVNNRWGLATLPHYPAHQHSVSHRRPSSLSRGCEERQIMET